MVLSADEMKYFKVCKDEVLSCDEVKLMDSFMQHGDISCLEHSIRVAYYSYALAIKLGLNINVKSLIRGALLHDFFLYDWHIKGGRKGLHGFRHPRIALDNANRLFTLDKIEEDIIIKHMFPLTVIPPKYKESILVCLVDKYCSLGETFNRAYKVGVE